MNDPKMVLPQCENSCDEYFVVVFANSFVNDSFISIKLLANDFIDFFSNLTLMGKIYYHITDKNLFEID